MPRAIGITYTFIQFWNIKMKKLINITALALSVITLAACATSTKAVQTNFEKTRTVSKSFDKTWESVVEGFANANIGIETLEKDSGLIVASSLYTNESDMEEFASCDKPGLLTTPTGGNAKYNVFVRKESALSTIVQVNTVFTQTLIDYNRIPQTSTCYSKGTLEAIILDRIEQP